MTPREWCLLEDGALDRHIARNRQIAQWMSPLISATAGKAITPAQLLGEKEPEADAGAEAAELKAAERKLKQIEKAMARQARRERTNGG